MNLILNEISSNIVTYIITLIMYLINYNFYKNFLGLKKTQKYFFCFIMLLSILDISFQIYDNMHDVTPAFMIILTLLLYSLIFILLLLYCNCNLILKIFTIITQNLIILLLSLIFLPFDFYIIPMLKSADISFIVILVQILTQYLFLKQLCKYINYKQNLTLNQSLMLFIPCLSIFLIANLFYYMQQFKLNNKTYFLPYISNKLYYLAIPFISILLGLSLLITAYTLRKVIDSQEEKGKNILMAHQYEMQINHSKNIEKLYSDIRKVEHDMKNHIICLKTLADNQDMIGIKSYISKLSNIVSSLTLKLKTGNVISDSIINEKNNIALSENINFNCDFFLPKNISIDSIDLCILLSNILDNSIEACEQIISKNISKNISIKSYLREPYLIIECINSYESPIKYKNDIIVTTKADKDKHGFGLITINEIASKYNGVVDIMSENNIFTISESRS